MRGLILAAVLTGMGVVPAPAEPIDLAQPYGNKDGCANRVQQEYYSEDMLLLTREALVTTGSACAIETMQAQANGSLILDTSCEYEGGDTEVVRFTVKRSPNGLRIFGPDGGDYGEVALCR